MLKVLICLCFLSHFQLSASDNPSAPQLVPFSSRSNLSFDEENGRWIATFSCSFTGDEPMDISWHYNGSRVWNEDENDNFEVETQMKHLTTVTVLKMLNFQAEFDVEYSCLAVNAHGYSSHDLWMEAPPELVIKHEEASLWSPGDWITAECKSFPDAQLFWQFPGDPTLRNDTLVELSTDSTGTLASATFIVTADDNKKTFRCCFLSRNPFSHANPKCAEISPNVSHPLSVTYSSDCSHHSGSVHNCSLTCVFSSLPVQNITVTWQFCSDLAEDLDTPCVDVSDLSNEITLEDKTVLSHLIDSSVRNGVYKCHAAGENDEQAEHSFLITGEQASSKAIVISQHKSDSQAALLECTFVSNPIDSYYWQFTRVGSSDGSTILKETSAPFNIELSSGNEETSSLMLSVDPFTIHEVARYSCVVSNSLNVMRSEDILLQILPEYSNFDIVISPVENVSDSTAVTAICSITSEVVPEVMQWRLLTEFDNPYLVTSAIKSEDNVHSTQLQFTADWRNELVSAKCEVSFSTAPSMPLIVIRDIKVNYEPGIVRAKNCSVEDFQEDRGGCRLFCVAQQDGRYVFQTEQWIYYTVNETEHVKLSGELISLPRAHRIKSTYFMSRYSAGFYRCLFTYKSLQDEHVVTVSHTFQIQQNEPGVAFVGTCASSSQCLALNSACLEEKCACETPTPVPYGQTACLPGVPLLESCVMDEQCSARTENSECEAERRICRCPQGSIFLAQPTPKCLRNVTFGGSCLVDEECLQALKFSLCLNLTCSCMETYTYDMQASICVIGGPAGDTEKVSTGSVVGIILLVAIVLAVAAAAISTSVKKYRRKQRRQRVKEAVDMKLDEVGPAYSGANTPLNANNSDTNYWYNPHQKATFKTSNAS